MRSVHEGKLFDDDVFVLLEYNSEGNIAEVKYRGVWLTVDNGYLIFHSAIHLILIHGNYHHIFLHAANIYLFDTIHTFTYTFQNIGTIFISS